MQKFAFFLLLLVGLIACQSPEHTAETPPRPNIILLMADDMGWGDTGYNGNDSILTPALDDMAARGVVMNRFYAAAPVCSPTRGSCLTGRNPYRYGINSANVGHLKPEEITLGEMLQAAGYRTGHFGKWHLGTLSQDTLDANRGGKPKHRAHYAPPWEHGFEVCFSTESKVPTWDPMITPEKEAGGVKGEKGSFYHTRYWTGPGEVAREGLEGDDSRVIMDRAIPFIQENAAKEQPFLAVIWFHTPHTPIVAGDAYKQKFADYEDRKQHYYGCIAAMDEQIDRLNAELAKLGVEENTLVFFTSDNGPENRRVSPRGMGITKGLSERKRSLQEGGIRVPGLMVYPAKVPGGKVLDIPFSTSDYLPTIAALTGISLPDARPLDGESILPFLSDQKPSRSPIAFRYYEQQALIDGNWKLYSQDQGESFALYDLAEDPAEQQDLSEGQAERFARMKQHLAEWRISQERSARGEDYE